MAIATGDTVTVEFTGRLKDGTVFDTSRESVAEETGLAETQPKRTYDPLTSRRSRAPTMTWWKSTSITSSPAKASSSISKSWASIQTD